MRPISVLIAIIFTVGSFAGSVSGQEKQPPKEKPPVVYLHQPLKEARLEVQRVRLKKPMEVVQDGVKHTISVVSNFASRPRRPFPFGRSTLFSMSVRSQCANTATKIVTALWSLP